MGHVSCSVRICSPFTERDVVARNQPFVPVFLFLIWGYGTLTADNDRAAQQPAKPALASQKTPSSSTLLPLQNPLTFSEQKRLSVLHVQTKAREGFMKDISTILLAS